MDTAAAHHGDFATRLYDKLAGTRPGKNLFMSPFSIRVALAMCAVGARGETRRVLADLIGAPESVEGQNRQFAALLKSINGEGERPFQLVTANALWGQQGYRFNPDFQEAVAEFYDGALHEVNFRTRPDEAVRAINAWVGGKTREKIKELVVRDIISEDTRLVLTNAIYFKGRWEKEFEKARTTDEEWYGPNGVGVVPMMHQRRSYPYYEGDEFQAVELPYLGGQLSMLVLLPRRENGLPAIETRAAYKGTYRLVTHRLHEEPVVLSVPRFGMEAEFRLKSVLCELGSERPFSAAADFSGIGEDRLAISEVVHKAFVEVNEEGTEASAATAVAATRGGGDKPAGPKVFKADHPFLVFIRHRQTNAVLFSGRVVNPR